MQGIDLLAGGIEFLIIHDDIIRNGETFLPAWLCRQNPTRLFLVFCIASQQAAQLGSFVAIDDQNAIHELLDR